MAVYYRVRYTLPDTEIISIADKISVHWSASLGVLRLLAITKHYFEFLRQIIHVFPLKQPAGLSIANRFRYSTGPCTYNRLATEPRFNIHQPKTLGMTW